MDNKLLPCPFCGNKAMIMQLPVGSKTQGMYTVGCIDDGFCIGHIGHISMTFVSKQTAADAWNKRS